MIRPRRTYIYGKNNDFISNFTEKGTVTIFIKKEGNGDAPESAPRFTRDCIAWENQRRGGKSDEKISNSNNTDNTISQ